MPDSYVGKVVAATPTLPDGQMNHLNLDTAGNLKVSIAGGVSVGAVTTSAQYNAAAPTFGDGTTNPLQANANGKLLVAPANTLATPLRIDPVGTTTQPVSLTDGTTTANNVLSDTGQNALITARGRKEVSFTTTTAQAVASTDVSNYAWASVHVVSQGTGSSVGFQASNDGTNWVSFSLSGINGQAMTSTVTVSSVIYAGPVNFRFFRLNVSGISAGTTSGIVEFFTTAPAQPYTTLSGGSATIGNVGLNTGSNTIGNVTLNASGNTIGNVCLQPVASGGLSTYKRISTADTNAASLKSSAGQLYNVQAFNTAATPRYVKLYNKASAPTVGTDTPIAVWMIPANGAGFVIELANGLACSAGIALAMTAGIADTDATAIGASEVVCNVQFK